MFEGRITLQCKLPNQWEGDVHWRNGSICVNSFAAHELEVQVAEEGREGG